MDSYRQALDISRKNGYRDKMVLALNNMVLTQRVLKDFQSARERYEEALGYAKESFILGTVDQAAPSSKTHDGDSSWKYSNPYFWGSLI